MIIPAGTLRNDRDEGLQRFIETVTDIRLCFQTHAFSGNVFTNAVEDSSEE